MPTSDSSSKSGVPAAGTLILVPTAAEARVIEGARGERARSETLSLCGFGPIAAAASTARQLALLRPQRVLLLGIAGSYDRARFPIGTATAFARVTVDGIGAGEGEGMLTPRDLGLPQWRDDGHATDVYDSLPLSLPGTTDAPALLTVCACSDSADQAEHRRDRFGEPAAEDMEGFGVALSCRQFDVPLCVVRGISNEAGDRDVQNWAIAPALQAAWETACALLDSTDWCVLP